MSGVISLLPVVLVLLLIAAMLRVSFLFHALYIVLGVYVLADLWSRRASRNLRATRHFPTRAINGDAITVQLEVANAGLWPLPWLRVFDRLPVALTTPPFHLEVISLLPRERATLTYTLQCRQRGYYALGPLSASSGDVFGLRTIERDFATLDHLTVFPKVVPLDELGLPSRSPFGQLRTQHPLYEDPARVVGVRDYQSGDSLRKVNWRATAASGRLQVRKLEPAMTLQTVLFVNLNGEEYDPSISYHSSELAIVVAASLATRLIDLRQEVGLIANGQDPLASEVGVAVAPRKGRAHLTTLLETLGRVEIQTGSAFVSTLRDRMAHLPWGATLVIVTSRETEELWETLIILRRSGFEIVTIFCGYPSRSAFDAASARAASLGFECQRVWEEEDLDVWRQRVQSWR